MREEGRDAPSAGSVPPPPPLRSVPLRVGVVPVRSTGALTGAGLLQGEHAWMQSLSFLDTPPTLLPPVLFPTLSLVTFSSLSSAFEAHISSSFFFLFFQFPSILESEGKPGGGGALRIGPIHDYG